MYISQSPPYLGATVTIYRYQVTHVNYWRGNAHRWHNTLHYSATSDSAAGACIPDMYSKLQLLGPAGAGRGGIAEIACYNTSTGGVPIASTVYFPWDTPTSWIPYTGTSWGGTQAPTNGEAAAHLRTQAGFSRTGKPVFVGLYWHAFTVDNTDITSAQSFSAATQTAVAAKYNALQTLSVAGTATAVQVTPSGGSIAGSGVLQPYVINHQRTRGRRKVSSRSQSKIFDNLSQLVQDASAITNLVNTVAGGDE